jgi:molecular chaperone DnaJ
VRAATSSSRGSTSATRARAPAPSRARRPSTCATCGGQGKVQQAGLGGMFRMVTACPNVPGAGQRSSRTSARRATARGGAEEAVADGQDPRGHPRRAGRPRAGRGRAAAAEVSPTGEGVRGDLHVVVRVEEHDLFEREGDHLLMEMPISFTQAALGAEVEVPTLTARTSSRSPRRTQHGAMFRVGGEGVPNLRSGRRRPRRRHQDRDPEEADQEAGEAAPRLRRDRGPRGHAREPRLL